MKHLEIHNAFNGKQGLEVVEKHLKEKNFDLIFVDYEMPVLERGRVCLEV